MAGYWTNKSAILRDLSMAQGRYVPGGVEQIVGANEKPPALGFTEETEEEFFMNCTAGGDFIPTPDLGLIKEMLNMVKDVDLSSGDDDETVEITKLNPDADEFKPTSCITPNGNAPNGNAKSAKIKKKLNRNVALTSLLTGIANTSEVTENNGTKELKLLKPDDFVEPVCLIEKNNIKGLSLSPLVMLDKKVSNTEPVIKENSPKKGKKVPTLSPVMMFKKKSVPNAEAVNTKENSANNIIKGPSLSPVITFKKRSVSNISDKADDDKKSVSPVYQNKEYKPSVRANQYYQKYIEQALLAKQRKEDIWTRAERLMKEMEAKRANTARIADAERDAASLTDTASVAETASVVDGASITDDTSEKDTDDISDIDATSVTDAAIVSDASNATPQGSDLSNEEISKLDIVRLPQHRHLLTGDCVVCIVMKKKHEMDQKNDEDTM